MHSLQHVSIRADLVHLGATMGVGSISRWDRVALEDDPASVRLQASRFVWIGSRFTPFQISRSVLAASACGSIPRRPEAGPHPVEMRPEPFLDRLRGLGPGAVVGLIRIVALVEELFAAVSFIADVDIIALRDRRQRAAMDGRPPLIRI